MCMLIYHSEKSHLTQKMLANFLKHNPDGFGFAYGDGRKVHVMKVPAPSAQEVFDLYGRYVKGREAIVHFRMRTHGDVTMDNTHPYRIRDDLWMAHNGVLHIGNSRRPEMSDTWHLIEDYLRPLLDRDPDLWEMPQFQAMLARYIGTNNRLAFVNRKGKVVLINESTGLWFQDTWFSNTYAWDPELFGAVEPKAVVYGGKTYYPGTMFTDPGRDARIAKAKARQDADTRTARQLALSIAAERIQKGEPVSKKMLKWLRKEEIRAQNRLAAKQKAKPAAGSTRTLVLPVKGDTVTYKGQEFDKSWLRSSFRDPAYGRTRPSDDRTLDIATDLLRQDMAPRD